MSNNYTEPTHQAVAAEQHKCARLLPSNTALHSRHTASRLLLVAILLASCCTQSLAVSQVNFVSTTPLVLQEGEQVSVTLVRTGTTSELQGTTTALLAVTGNGASSDFSSAIIGAFFNPGVTVSSILITVNQDNEPEIEEAFSLQIQTALGSAIGTNNALNITVLSSDDPYGVVGFDSDSVTVSIPEPFSEAENDPTLTVERIGAFGEVDVQWRLIGDASQDFSESQGTITFPDQIDSVSLSLPVIRDEVMEPDELFQIELFSVNGGARLSSNTVANLTITRNDIPVYLFCPQTEISEDSETISCDITRGLGADGNPVGSFSHESTLTISTFALSATSQSDFLAISSSITFQTTTTQSISIRIIDDSTAEDDETFQLRIRNPSSDIHIFTPVVNLTIIGNDGAGGVVSLPDMSDVIAMEGGNAMLIITRTESTVGVVTVSWEASHRLSNTSLAGDDIITPGTSSIADGDSQAHLLVPIISDGLPEAAEPFLITLTSVTSNIGRLASSQLSESFIVRDSDSAYGLLEWDDTGHTITLDPRTLSLRLVRRKGLEFNIVINYNVSYVPAGTGIDTQIQNYVVTPGLTVIHEGRDYTIINLTIADNAFLEAQGRFYATLQSASIIRTDILTPLLVEPPSSPTIGMRDKLLVSIPEHAINGRIGFTDASRRVSVEEGTSSQPTRVNLTVERDGSAGQATISYAIVAATSEDTFTAADLEQSLVDTVVLPEGESSSVLTILIKADSIPEVEETFVVSLLVAAEQNQQINGAASASFVTIRASDTPGGTISLSTDSVGPFIVSENISNSVMLTLVRTGAFLTEEIVQYEITSNGPQDFYASGFEVIGLNQASKTLLLLPFDDTIPELEESFNLTIIGVSDNAILGEPYQAQITILENDYPHGLFQFEELAKSISESTAVDPSQYNTAEFRVVRDRGTFGNVSVEWRIVQSDASYDVTPTSGALSYTEGQSDALITISVLPDDIPEGVEVFTVELHSPVGGAMIEQSRSEAQLSVLANDDPITFTRLILDVNESPGSMAQVSITRGGQAADRATVKLRTREDSAKESEDFSPYMDFLIIFEVGQRNMSISTAILDDDIPEIEERFFFELYEATGDSVVHTPSNVSVYIAPNDDPNGIVSFHPSSLRVSGAEGRSTGLLIQRTRGSFGRLSILFNVTGISVGPPGLPPSPGDLSFTNGIFMPDGSANTTLSIQVLDDNIPELEDVFQISIICPIFGSPPLIPGPKCASENLTVTFTVPENDDPYGAYGWTSEDVFVPEDLPPGAAPSERERTLTISQYGGTLAGAELLWELTASGLEAVPLADLIFLGGPGSAVSVYPSRADTGTTAYLFSGGSNSLLTVPTQYQPTADDLSLGFTLSAFLRANSSSAGYIMARQSSDFSLTYYGVRIRVSSSTSYLRYEYTLTSAGSSSFEAELPTDAFDDAWSHLAVVHQTFPSPSVRLYFRGVELGTGSVGSGGIVEDSSGVLSVGATGAGAESLSGIALQDVRVYFAPLNAAQISSISLNRPAEDVSPVSGYASFAIGQTNTSTPLIRVKEDDIPEATEVVYPRVLSIKGPGRIRPTEGTSRFSILASDTGNGIFQFQSSQPVSLASEAEAASLPISRTFSVLGGVYAHWAVYLADGSTLAENDFIPASGRLLMAEGDALSDLVLTPVDDQVPELAESYIVSLTGLSSEDGTTPSTPTSAHYLGSTQSLSLRIEDNDAPYGLLQFDTSGIPVQDDQSVPAATLQPTISVLEESVNISLQVVRAQGTVGDISVQYFTSSLDADGIGSDRDYVNAVGTVAFSSGQRSQFVNIALVDDSIPELAESFQLILSAPMGIPGTPTLGIGSTINITIGTSDDAFGVLSFTTESLSRVVSEEDVDLNLNLQRTGGLLGDVTVQWMLQGANGPTDITPNNGSISFAQSVNSAAIQLNIVQDEISEFLEVFQVQLFNVAGGARLSSSGDTQATISIQASDYPHGLFNFPQGQRSISEQEGSTFTLTINRQFGSSGDIRVNFSTSVTATQPASPSLDYVRIENGYVDFNSGVTTRTIEITVLQDDVPEADERFDVLLVSAQLLSAPQPGMPTPMIDTGAASRSEVTISENDDARGVFSFTATQLTVSEPTGDFIYVQRSAGVFGITAVRYTVTLVTAISNDLSSATGQVTFTEGTDLVALPLRVEEDFDPEFDESFTVTLLSPTGGARLASSNTSVVVTISENDDIHGLFEFVTGSRFIDVEEPPFNPLSVDLVLERREGAEGVVRITWIAMLAGGESADDDVETTAGELLYQPQERTKTFSIQISPDTVPEGLEAVEVMIASVTGGARAGDASTAVVNILPNDAPHGVVSFSSAQFAVNEEEESSVARISLNREFGSLGDLQVSYYTTQFNILEIAFSNPNTTESDYFTDSQSLLLTGAQDELQRSDISASSNHFVDCARLCLSSFTCYSLSHSTTVCILYRVTSSQTSSAASTFNYHEKRTELTEPLRLSIASDGGDYVGTTRSNITIPDGVDVGYIEVTILADTVPEFGEWFGVTLTSLSVLNMSVSNPVNIPTFGSLVETRVEVARSDFPNGLFRVSLSGGIQTLVIPENFTDLITGTIYRDRGVFGVVSVHYSLIGTATSVEDFGLAEATFVFNPGEIQKPFSFLIVEDNIAEGDETIIIQLDDPMGGAEVIQGVGSVVTIQIDANDNGGGIISFPNESMSSVVEEGRVNFIRIIRKVGAAGQARVTWVLTGNRSEEEFSSTNGSALFQDGLAYAFIELVPRNDTLPETPLVYSLTITGVRSVDIAQTGGAILDPDTSLLTAVVTLAESDMPHGVVEFTSSQVVYSQQEEAASSILISRKFGTIGNLRLSYISEVGNLTALNTELGPQQRALASESDIVSGVQYLLIPDGVASLTLALTVVDDIVPEFGEVFILRLVSVELLNPPPFEPAAIKPPTLGVNIRAEMYIPPNDAPQGYLQFFVGSFEVLESAGKFNVSVERTSGNFGPASCRIELTSFQSSLPIATRDSDYFFESKEFFWAVGELGVRTFEVEIVDDPSPESREVIQIGITQEAPAGVARGENSTLTIIILGSDLGRGIFTIDPTFTLPPFVREGTSIQIPIQRSFSTLGEVFLPYRVLPATLPADLFPPVGQVVFQDGQASAGLRLDVVSDGLSELVEQHTVEILPPLSPEGTMVVNRTSIQVYVSENENPYGRFEVYLLQRNGERDFRKALVEEDDGLLQVVIERSDGLNREVTVDFQVSAVSAISNSMGDQYTLSITQQLFPASEWLSFVRDGEQYAISVYGSTSRLYRWIGIYDEMQTFVILMATSWHSFSWNNSHYLAVSSYDTSIELFRYNSTSSSYSLLQSIPRPRSSHLHSFSTGGQLYLFASISSDDTGNTDTNSVLLEWDASLGLFNDQPLQQLATRGAAQALTFVSSNTLYLVVANSYDSAQQTSNTPSIFYQWSASSSRFELVSSISTAAATSLSLITDSNDAIYLLATNQTSLFVFSWAGQTFNILQQIDLAGNVSRVRSILFQSQIYAFVSVIGRASQVYRLSSGLFAPLQVASTPDISSSDIAPVELDAQLFTLVAVPSSQSLLFVLGSWKQDADFFERRATLTFSPNQSSMTQLVELYPDDTPEVTEDFIIQLSNPTNEAVLDDMTSNLTVRILTNDNAHGVIGFSPDSQSVILPELSVQDLDRRQDFTLEVVRSGGTFGTVIISYLVTGEAVEDIFPTQSTIMFTEGSNTTTLPLRVLDDMVIELSEAAQVTLTAVTLDGNTDSDVSSTRGAQLDSASSSASVTIQANDYPHGLLTFSPSSRDVTVDEPGTNNLTSITLTIIREFGLNGAISIEIETQTASTYPPAQQAQPHQDFTPTSSQVTMQSGGSLATVTVSILPDLIPETTETFWVRIVSARLLDEADRQGSLSDSPRPKNQSLEVAEVRVSPNDEFRGILSFDVPLSQDGSFHVSESAGNLTFPVTRTSGTFGQIGASWRIEPISTSPIDFTPTSGSLSYSDGEDTNQIEFRILDDAIPEIATTYRIVLHSPVGGARIGDSELTLTIDESDDIHGLFFFAQGSELFSLQEPGENATQPSSATFFVERGRGLLGEVTIAWEVESAANGDVTPLSGQLIYPENVTTADFRVSLVDDSTAELEVSYQVRLVSATNGGNIAETRSIATIFILANDNPTGRISIPPEFRYVVVAESSSVSVELNRTQGAFYRVNVAWELLPASASQHFLTTSETAVFDVGEQTASILLQTIPDFIPESAQIFTLQLRSATVVGSNVRAVIEQDAAGRATVVVAASDQPHGRIEFQSQMSSFPESAGVAGVTVSRGGGSIGRILVNFTLSTPSAVVGQDYQIAQNYLEMQSGQNQAQIQVTLIDDPNPELNEVIQLVLTSVSLLDSANDISLPPQSFNPGGVQINIPPTLGTSTVHTLTIEESDDPYGIIEFSQSVYSVNEGELAQIQVNRLGGTIGVQSVQFTILEGSAKLGQDFNTGGGTLSGTLIIQEGASSSPIQLQVVDDPDPEDTENLAITLQSINGNARLGNRTAAQVHIEISDDPFGVIGFNPNFLVSTVTNPTVSQGPVTISLTVDRNRGTMGSVQVQYQMLPTTQLQQVHQDLSPTSGTITFADGVDQQFIIINVLPEDGPEVEEHYIVSLVLSTGTLDVSRVNSSIFITGRGMPYGIAGFAPGQDSFVFEEPEVSTEVSIGIVRTEGTHSSVLVYWEARGNVTASDISPLSGSVELPHWDGAISAYPLYNLNFVLLSDTQAEDTQVFTIQLTSTSAATTIDSSADTVTITIRANDFPHGLFSIDPNSLLITLDQSAFTRAFSFTVVRAQGVLTDATLSYSLSYLDPVQPGNLTLRSGDLLIPDGVARMDFSFPISADTFLGTNGSLVLSLTAVTALGTAATNLPPRIDSANRTVSLTVLEQQANARISFSPSSLSPIVDGASNTVEIVLVREGSFGEATIRLMSGQTTLSATLRNGMIAPSVQYLNFALSEREKKITLLLSPNLNSIDPEIFTLRLVAAANSTSRALPNPTADTSVIEPRGVVGFPADQIELRVEESSQFAVLDVFRLFGSSESISVVYGTEQADSVRSPLFEELAVAGADYDETRGLLNFQQFQTRGQIRVPIRAADTLSGRDKLFRVVLTAAADSSGQISASPRLRNGFMTALVIIVDDDSPAGVFRFSESRLTVQEQFQLIVIPILRGSSDIIFPANVSVRTVPPGMADSFGVDFNRLDVNFERTDNATADLDYLAIDEQLIYSLNDTTMQVSLRILDENIPEIDKLILLQLYNPSYKSMLSVNMSLISVIVQANDDSGGILRFSDSSLNLEISEDSNPSIQVGLTRDLSILGQVSIQWQAKLTPSDAPATAEEISQLSTQLEFTSGAVTFGAGVGTASFTLSLKQDNVPELEERFYLLLLSESIQPAAVLDQSRKLATVVSRQSDFPFGNIQFSPNSRYIAVTSSESQFTIRLTVERVGGTLGSVIIPYNTPAATQGNATIGSYIPSPAQINTHYLSADGTLNLTEGRTAATIQVTILGNPLSAGAIRFFHVELSPLPPAESGNRDYLRATIYITGHGNELQLLDIYSQQSNGVALASDISVSLLRFLTEQTTSAANVEAQVIRAVLDQLITDGASGSYAQQTGLQSNVLSILDIIVRGGNFPGYAFFADVIESFSYSLLESQPCPMPQPLELRSSMIGIQVLKRELSSLNGYQFTSNGHTVQLPQGLLASDPAETCGQAFLAEIGVAANSIFRDPGLDAVFRESVLSVGVRDSSRNRITSLPAPVTYRLASSGDLVKLKNSRCLFWDFNDAKWSTRGCSAIRQPIEQHFIECQCDHLTNFAADALTDARYSFGVAMAVLSGLVIFAIVFSLIVHLLYYTKFQLITHLIMNLLLALLLCEVTFLLASVLSPTADVSGCVALGVALHYFTLVAFLWFLLIVMAIILVVYYGALAYEYVQLLLYALFGWLAPGIVILLTFFIFHYGIGFELSQVYGDVYGNGDLCFLPNFIANIITNVAPISVCFLLSLFGIILLFLMTGMSNNQDLKFDNIYFTSKNTTEVIKLLGLLIVIGVDWILCAIHLLFGQHYTLAFSLVAQLVLAVYIAVVYGGLVIYIFLSARRKSYYPKEDINDINAPLPPVATMSFGLPQVPSPASLLEEKIYTNPSIPDASSIPDSSYPPSDVVRDSAMVSVSADPEIEDLIYTIKAGDLDQDSYFQNESSNSDPSVQEVFSQRRISIADTHL